MGFIPLPKSMLCNKYIYMRERERENNIKYIHLIVSNRLSGMDLNIHYFDVPIATIQI